MNARMFLRLIVGSAVSPSLAARSTFDGDGDGDVDLVDLAGLITCPFAGPGTSILRPKACELYFSQAIIWVKEHPVLTRKDFMGNHEWCFYGWRQGTTHVFLGPNNATDVWSVKKVNPQSMIHLAEKPVELAVRRRAAARGREAPPPRRAPGPPPDP
ncbi:MAG: hypothetical protein V2A79_08305 [Planctomycetota bacterium]